MTTTTPKQAFDPYLLPDVTGTAYLVPTNTVAVVKHLAVHNTSDTPVEVTVWLVENGGTATDSNQIFKRKIAGYDGKIVFPAINATLETGATIQAKADTVSVISIFGSVNEVV